MPAEIAQTLETGTRILALLVFGVLLGLGLLDLYWEVRRYHSLAHRIQTWSRSHPAYGLAVLLLVGALLSHFFWQELSG